MFLTRKITAQFSQFENNYENKVTTNFKAKFIPQQAMVFLKTSFYLTIAIIINTKKINLKKSLPKRTKYRYDARSYFRHK